MLTFWDDADFVKELIQTQPQYLKALGPHGFTWLHHADVGGQATLAEWLKTQGLSETKFKAICLKFPGYV